MAGAGRRRRSEKLATEGCGFRTLSGDGTRRARHLEVAQWCDGSVVQRPGWQHAEPHTVLSVASMTCAAHQVIYAVSDARWTRHSLPERTGQSHARQLASA